VTRIPVEKAQGADAAIAGKRDPGSV